MQFPLSGLLGTSTRWKVRPAGRTKEKRRPRMEPPLWKGTLLGAPQCALEASIVTGL
jgi:hypothetical protein